MSEKERGEERQREREKEIRPLANISEERGDLFGKWPVHYIVLSFKLREKRIARTGDVEFTGIMTRVRGHVRIYVRRIRHGAREKEKEKEEKKEKKENEEKKKQEDAGDRWETIWKRRSLVCRIISSLHTFRISGHYMFLKGPAFYLFLFPSSLLFSKETPTYILLDNTIHFLKS